MRPARVVIARAGSTQVFEMNTNDANPPPIKRRILCIDGGGILGTFPAAFLAGLEEHLDGRPVGSHFDLIAGTSTGGIIAIGLALGLTAKELLQLYETHGPAIFGQGRGAIRDSLSRLWRTGRWALAHKHDAGPLKAALESVFKTQRIGDARTRLLIPAWNPLERGVYIYKTAHHHRLRNDYKALAVDAAMATAAAPTYFPQHVTGQSVGLSDGGTWANNPTALAVVEALTLLGWPKDSLHILSVSCLNEVYTVRKSVGIGTLGTKILNLFMDGQSHGALGMAKLLTGHQHEREAIYRIDPEVPRGDFKMDDPRVIQDMKGMGFALARKQLAVLAPVFFGSPAEAFTPVYRLDGGRT